MKVGIIIDVETRGKKDTIEFLYTSAIQLVFKADPLRKLKRNLIPFMMKAKKWRNVLKKIACNPY